MKNRFLCGVLSALVMVSFFSACSSKDEMQEAVFEMEENATTGYIWQVSQEGDGSMDIQREVIEDTSAASSSEMIVGVGQMIRYTLVPQNAGEVNVTFELERPWEGGEEAYEASFTFDVSDNGTCVLISQEESIEGGGSAPLFEGPLGLE